jgi:hypothetical protein
MDTHGPVPFKVTASNIRQTPNPAGNLIYLKPVCANDAPFAANLDPEDGRAECIDP